MNLLSPARGRSGERRGVRREFAPSQRQLGPSLQEGGDDDVATVEPG